MIIETYNLVTVIIYTVSAIIALFMLGIALYQLKQLTAQVTQAVKSNSISQLSALLALEQQIADRRLVLSEAGIAVSEAKNVKDAEFTALELRLNEAKQMYLNALDRLCFCVNKELLDAEDMRLEYRDIIKAAVKDFPEDFTMATTYRNIKKVYESWADK
ncbi:hypothetical protein RUK17_003283 [Vibrio cholerae]|uniref:hypothetical protein n=1 Tax=Vibrio cholerae TaxID=666 RepID=UPI000BA8F72A|nr:hypothetical protein [Vibrio cholerae]EKF9220286.1 hypothetical protein [Vibrio cholerae]EKF9746129.1 hypothetical protein [Vibrio cholerae]EKF9803366.1 hypothetical protein [Vibrio cholerae]ELJ8469389.1 hypothetical protein [Vibrio cholerae]PAS27193.1 hypothetical protein CGT72_18465 [Vibrio cholerae]